MRNSLDLPRSSPRDMGVVRSDMEMEEIIARLEAEEAAQSRFERNLATIPAQILDAKEKRARRFIDSNSLVLDPVHEVRLHALATTWQEAEKKIFLEKYLAFPKNFRKIATYLPHKTPNDCSEHYYRVKKELDLKNMLRDVALKKKAKAAESQAMKSAKAAAPKGALIGRRRGSNDDGLPGEEEKPKSSQAKKKKAFTEEDKQVFLNAMKEHGKNWKELSKQLGYSYAELRSLYTTWKDMIDPMLNAVARQKKRREKELKGELSALQEGAAAAVVSPTGRVLRRDSSDDVQRRAAAVVKQEAGRLEIPPAAMPPAPPAAAVPAAAVPAATAVVLAANAAPMPSVLTAAVPVPAVPALAPVAAMPAVVVMPAAPVAAMPAAPIAVPVAPVAPAAMPAVQAAPVAPAAAVLPAAAPAAALVPGVLAAPVAAASAATATALEAQVKKETVKIEPPAPSVAAGAESKSGAREEEV